VGDAAVQHATGKTWAQWCVLLDKAGARQLPHRRIAILLQQRHGLGGWWAQMVTVGYEQVRGLRVRHQRAVGYEVGASKTLDVAAAAAFLAWQDARLRSRWLQEPISVRKATPPKSLRLDWSGGAEVVSVNIYPKGAGKCQVVVQHGKLKSAAAARRAKAFWSKALDRLKGVLQG
jgi:hypothetical protein